MTTRRVLHPVRVKLAGLGVLTMVGLMAAGCGATPGSKSNTGASKQPANVTTDISKAGKVTLNVWDYEVGNPPRAKSLTMIDKAFEAKYPNVTIKRRETDFNTYLKQAKLTLSASGAPCVAEGGQGFVLDGPLVQAGLLRPLDSYAKAYGWDKVYPTSMIKQFYFTPDGKTFGQGNLYGMSPAGEVGGWFYNKRLLAKIGGQVPQTFSEFEALLAKAKAAGVTPILLGNADKWPASHIFSAVANQLTPGDQIQALVYGGANGTWSVPGFVKAMQTVKDWVAKGYIEGGFDGVGYNDAATKFAAGKALMVQGGPWLTGTIQPKLGNASGFFVTPPVSGHTQATGSLGSPFHITSSCKTPDVAAAYINEMLSPEGQQAFIKNDDLPANDPSATFAPGTQEDVLAGFQRVIKDGGLTPYLDWTTVSTGDVLFAGLQSVLAGKEDPGALLKKLDADRQKAYAS